MELLAGLIGVLGAVLGAIVGAIASIHYGRPRPIVLVDKISITSDVKTPAERVRPNRTLKTRCDNSPFDIVVFPAAVSVERRHYIEVLQRAVNSIDELTFGTLPTLSATVTKLNGYLLSNNYPEFEKEWAREWGLIWSVVEGGHSRREFAYGSQEPDYGNVRSTHEIIRDEDGDLTIALPGVDNLYFIWTARASQKERTKAFAERTARAFAFRHRDDLNDLMNYLSSISNQAKDLLEIRTEVLGELASHERLVVKGLICNAGATPFSILNRCRLVVDLKGYPYADSTANGKDDHHVCESDGDVAMVLAGTGAQFETPLSIGAGATHRFAAVSERPIKDLPVGKALRSAFRGGERRFFLEVISVVPGNTPTKQLRTRARIFRDLPESES